MNTLEINPYIRVAMRSTLLAPSHINRRIIFDYELIYIDDGCFMLTYNEKDFPCKKGDFLLLCPNIPHSFHILTSNVSQPHIHFDLKYDFQSQKVFVSFKDYPDLTTGEQALIRENIFPHLASSPFLKINRKETFRRIFYEIVDTRDAADLNALSCKSRMLYLLEEIISENAPNLFHPEPTNSGIAPLIKSYIDSNYEQDIQLGSLEQQFGYSKFYIERLFRQEYGVSIINYRNRRRLEEATRLLEDHSVTETAEILGFSSIYTFSRAFRTAYGISPTNHVKRQKSCRAEKY